jgi:hypothetical protein
LIIAGTGIGKLTSLDEDLHDRGRNALGYVLGKVSEDRWLDKVRWMSGSDGGRKGTVRMMGGKRPGICK